MQLSAERVWDSSTGVPGMLKHIPSGRYYSRIQVGGTRTMKALKTRVWRIAKLRHLDKIAKAERQRQRRQRVIEGRGLMGDLVERYRTDYLANTTRAKRSKASLKSTIERLQRCWRLCFGTDIRLLKPQQITANHARRVANYMPKESEYRWHNTKNARKGYGAVTVNKTIELLHRVLRIAVETGALPALTFELDPVVGEPIRKHEERKKLRLPSSAKMQELFAQMRVIDYKLPEENPELRAYLIDRAAESADFAEFMAYSGARVGEAAAFRWEDDLEKSVILRGTKSEHSADREVPKIEALRDLLRVIRARRKETGQQLKGKVFSIKQCREALTTACGKVGIERLTHHSLRHFFATICIEAGVDIPTISRWLGHADGGVLAMQTYGHLRTEHSFAAAAKVKVGTAAGR